MSTITDFLMALEFEHEMAGIHKAMMRRTGDTVYITTQAALHRGCITQCKTGITRFGTR